MKDEATKHLPPQNEHDQDHSQDHGHDHNHGNEHDHSLGHLTHKIAEEIGIGVNALHLNTHHVPHAVERLAIGAELVSNIANSTEPNVVKRTVCSAVKIVVGEAAKAPVVTACGDALAARFPISAVRKLAITVGLSAAGTPLLNTAARPAEDTAEDICYRTLTITEHRAENGEPEEILELPRYDIVGNHSVITLTRDPLLRKINTELQPTSHTLNPIENHRVMVTNPLAELENTITNFKQSTTSMISRLTTLSESPLQNVNAPSEIALTTFNLCQQNPNNQTNAIVVNADQNCALKQITQESREIADRLQETFHRTELNLSAALDKQNYQHWGSGAPTYYSGPATLFAVNELWGLSNSISEPPSLLDKKEEFSNKNGLSRSKKFDLETNYKYGPGGFSLSNK